MPSLSCLAFLALLWKTLLCDESAAARVSDWSTVGSYICIVVSSILALPQPTECLETSTLFFLNRFGGSACMQMERISTTDYSLSRVTSGYTTLG
jgi:hypothetical protein